MTVTLAIEKGHICGARYRIDSLIGDGGMATVYRAFHTETDRAVALKLVRPEFAGDQEVREMFVREARVCARIGRSDHIVDVLDAGIDEGLGLPFMAMELLEGEPLDARIRKQGALSVSDTLALTEQLADGLEQAHLAGVFHRDLKPQNLFLCKSRKALPTLKILDFGIAKLAETTQQSSTHVGTPAYSAPEQLGPAWRAIGEQRGITIANVVSAATDIWAMGLVVFEMLTGAQSGALWGATTLAELPVKIVLEPPPLPSRRGLEAGHHLPAALDPWMARCLHLDATKRFASALEAFQALASALGQQSPALSTAAPSLAPNTPAQAHPLAVQKTIPTEPAAMTSHAGTPLSSELAFAVTTPPVAANYGRTPAESFSATPPRVQPPTQAQPATQGHAAVASSPPPAAFQRPQPAAPAYQHGSHDPQLTAWATYRQLELRAVADPRPYVGAGTLHHLGRIILVGREARLLLPDGELLLAEVAVDEAFRKTVNEDRLVIAVVHSPRLRYRCAVRSKRASGLADGMAKGLKILDDLVNRGRPFLIGDPWLEQRYDLAGPSPEEAHAALPMPLRQYLIQSGFTGSLEFRTGFCVIAQDGVSNFEPRGLDRLLDTASRVYATFTG